MGSETLLEISDGKVLDKGRGKGKGKGKGKGRGRGRGKGRDFSLQYTNYADFSSKFLKVKRKPNPETSPD